MFQIENPSLSHTIVTRRVLFFITMCTIEVEVSAASYRTTHNTHFGCWTGSAAALEEEPLLLVRHYRIIWWPYKECKNKVMPFDDKEDIIIIHDSTKMYQYEYLGRAWVPQKNPNHPPFYIFAKSSSPIKWLTSSASKILCEERKAITITMWEKRKFRRKKTVVRRKWLLLLSSSITIFQFFFLSSQPSFSAAEEERRRL